MPESDPARPAASSRSAQRSLLPLVVSGLGASAFVVAGAVGIAWARAEVYSPTAPVQRYLEVLHAGDGSAAAGIAQASLAEPGSAGTALLDGDLLAAASSAVQDLAVQDAGAPDESTRQIEVTGTVDGEPLRTVFTVRRTGTDWLFFDHWEMEPLDLPTVTVQPQGLSATSAVNGSLLDTELPLTDDQGTVVAPRLAVFPPAQLAVGFSSSHLASETQTVTVTRPGEHQTSVLAVRPTDQAIDDAEAQLSQLLQECTAQQVLHPTGCPLDYQTAHRVDPASIRWEIVQVPDISALVTGSTADSRQGTVEGVAEISLTERDLMTGEQRAVRDEVPFELEAQVLVTTDALTVSAQRE